MNKKERLKEIMNKMKELNTSEKFNQTEWDKLKSEADQVKADITSEEARTTEMNELENFANTAPAPVSKGFNPSSAVPRDSKERPFNSLGDQLQAVVRLTNTNIDIPFPVDQAENRLRAVNEAAGVRTALNPEAGFLIQTDYATSLRESAMETGALSSRVDRQPIGPGSDGFEYMEVEDKDRSNGPWGGAFKVYRKGEYDQMQSGKSAKLLPREIRLQDMYGMLYVTNRTLRDTTALTALINRGYADGFAFKMDQEIFEGTGTGQCLGILNSNAVVTVAKETSQAAATITVNNILKMFYSMPGRFLPNAVWFISQVGVQEILPTLKIGDTPVYLPPTGISGGLYGTLLGRPVIPCEHCPAIGSKGDILFADMNQYLVIEKGGTQIDTSIHVKFDTDETAFRFIQRTNGQPWDGSTWKTLKGNKYMGPFVALAERA